MTRERSPRDRAAELIVWAPRARGVELVTGGVRRACAAAGDGRWTCPAPRPGDDYAISLDGGPPRPDPRSRLQPHGVHGASRWYEVDHAWTDAGWTPPPLASGVIYELHVGTFTPRGTFDGAIERLGELVALGVTHVELLPVAAFPGVRGWGYDGVDLYAAHAPYGGPAGLCRLVDACHARGLAVILDVVYNHLGPDGNYLAELGPYFTDRHHTPWGQAVNLDGPGAAGVRRFLLDNARWWLEACHLDGLRLDATHAMYDDSATHLLAELGAETRALADALGRDLVLIAEHEATDPRTLRPRPAGWGLDGVWYDDFHHAIHAALTGERHGYYAPWGRLAQVAATLRGATAGVGDAPGLVACIQNHDQVGNRALGDRLHTLVSPGRLRLAAALLLTSPLVPLLFMGEEWAASTPFLYFTDHQDPGLAEAVRRGRRTEHAAFVRDPDDVPDPQDPATMARSVLRWDERARTPHAEVLAWYEALIRLRRGRADLSDARRDRVAVDVDEAAGALTVRRGGVTVAGNVGPAPIRISAPPGRVVAAFPALPRRDGDAFVIPPDGCAVWAADHLV